MATVRTRTLFAIAALVLCASAAVAQQPTLAGAQADFAAGNHRACLQKISRVLSGPTARGGSKERYDLLMLRGECLLNLKSPALAAEAFESASRVTRAGDDLKPTAVAKATAILIEHSPGLVFKPRGAAEGIDIVRPESRAKAMAALFDETFPEVKEQASVATKATDVAVMWRALAPVADAYVVELTTTGDTKQSAPLFAAIGAHARAHIAEELDKTGKRVDALAALAQEPKDPAATPDAASERRGLIADEQEDLAQVGKLLETLRLAAQDGRRISRRLGTTGEQWDPLVAECADVRERAQAVTGTP